MPLTLSMPRRSILVPLTLAGCWTLWVVTNASVWAMKAPDQLRFIARNRSVDGLAGLLVCGLLFWIYDRARQRLELGALLLSVVPLCFTSGMLWQTASSLAMWRLGWSWDGQLNLGLKPLLIGGGLANGTTLALFTMLYFAIDHWLQLRDQQEKAREATSLAHQAQLQMLRYQLNPHFLFNALNSIRAMILREPERARQIVTELSEFLRYSLNGHGPESTLGEEMQAIENYLAIQRIRFEEKLVVTTRVDPALLDLRLPGFLLHPLVENAVKYGMETSAPPLRIELDIGFRGEEVVFRVANTGRLVTAAEAAPDQPRNGTGTGLNNVTQRLRLAFPNRHHFSLVERDGWVRTEIVLHPAPPTEASA